MATLQELHTALVNAHNAGDAEAAKTIAGEISRLSPGKYDVRPKAKAEVSQDPYTKQAKEDNALQNLGAGIGGAFAGLGLGARQLTPGVNVNPQEVRDWKSSMAGLRSTPAGSAGEIIGTAAPIAAAGVLSPVANTLRGAATLGAVQGGLMPSESGMERLGNVAGGVAGNMSGQWLGNKLGNAVSTRMADQRKALADAALRNTDIDNTLREALQAGYILPPGMAGAGPGMRALESVSGKIATQQEFAGANQAITDDLARKAAGLAQNSPINPQTLSAARDTMKQPYRDIGARGFQQALDDIDAARANARAAWKEYERQHTRSALVDAQSFGAQAKALEAQLDNALTASGRPDLVQAFRQARANLAKNHNVEEALIEGGGSVDARTIAKMTQRGDPLSGELKTIGDFANNFPRATQPDKMTGSVGVSKLAAGLGSLLAGGGGATMGPAGIALGAAPFVIPPMARALLKTGPVQRSLIPDYSMGIGSKMMEGITPLVEKSLPGVLGAYSPQAIAAALSAYGVQQ